MGTPLPLVSTPAPLGALLEPASAEAPAPSPAAAPSASPPAAFASMNPLFQGWQGQPQAPGSTLLQCGLRGRRLHSAKVRARQLRRMGSPATPQGAGTPLDFSDVLNLDGAGALTTR